MCAVMPVAQYVSGAYYVDCVVAQEAMCVNNVDDTKGLCGHGVNVAPIISTASAVNLTSHS